KAGLQLPHLPSRGSQRVRLGATAGSPAKSRRATDRCRRRLWKNPKSPEKQMAAGGVCAAEQRDPHVLVSSQKKCMAAHEFSPAPTPFASLHRAVVHPPLLRSPSPSCRAATTSGDVGPEVQLREGLARVYTPLPSEVVHPRP